MSSSLLVNAGESKLPDKKPELKRQVGEIKSVEDVKHELTDGVKNPVCFITNFPLSKIKINDLKGMEPIYTFGEGFVNRSPKELLELDYYNVFINCTEKEAKKWFNKNIKLLKDSGFRLIVVYDGRGVEKSLWLEGLKELGVHMILQLKDFAKARKGAINAEQFLDELQSLALKIDSPPLTTCCGLVSLFRKKKAEEKN